MRNMNRTVNIQAGQNIVDVCLQEYGTMEFLYDMHADNGLQDFPATLPAGSEITVYPEKITGSKRGIAILQQWGTIGTGN